MKVKMLFFKYHYSRKTNLMKCRKIFTENIKKVLKASIEFAAKKEKHKVKEIFLEILAASDLFKTTVLEVISVYHSLLRFKKCKN